MALWMLVFSISTLLNGCLRTILLQRVKIKGWKWPATVSPHALCWATVISTGAPLRIVLVKAFCEEVSFERGWCWMAELGIKDLCWTKDGFIDADGASCCVELTWLLVAWWALFLRGVSNPCFISLLLENTPTVFKHWSLHAFWFLGVFQMRFTTSVMWRVRFGCDGFGCTWLNTAL